MCFCLCVAESIYLYIYLQDMHIFPAPSKPEKPEKRGATPCVSMWMSVIEIYNRPGIQKLLESGISLLHSSASSRIIWVSSKMLFAFHSASNRSSYVFFLRRFFHHSFACWESTLVSRASWNAPFLVLPDLPRRPDQKSLTPFCSAQVFICTSLMAHQVDLLSPMLINVRIT